MTTFSVFTYINIKLVFCRISFTKISNFYLISNPKHRAAKKSLPQKLCIKSISHVLGHKVEEKSF